MPEEALVQKFENRAEAGRFLAGKLSDSAGRDDVAVLALPRGGVPVAFEVAQALNAPLDVFVVRKLGLPGREELAMGAIASGGIRVLNDDVIDLLDVSSSVINEIAAKELAELKRREQLYRHGLPAAHLRDKTVILIDDGLATGATMRAAVAAVRQLHPKRLIVAVPVAARETCEALRAEADEVICAITPSFFRAVGTWYEDFSQTTDQEVRDLLDRAARRHPVEAGRE
jgi:putative phosphoribosyl transferase